MVQDHPYIARADGLAIRKSIDPNDTLGPSFVEVPCEACGRLERDHPAPKKEPAPKKAAKKKR